MRLEDLQIVVDTARPLAEHLGLVLVDVAYGREQGGRVLRFTLDRPQGGITLAEIEAFSRQIDPKLDELTCLDESYRLEVSSPGLTRPLRKERDFEIFSGRRIYVTTYAPVAGRKEFRGTLKGLIEGRVLLEGPDGEVHAIARELVAKARLDEVDG